MKAGLTLSALAAELDRQNAAKQDYVVDTRELTMLTPRDEDGKVTGSAELHLPGGVAELAVRPTAHRQIGSRLAIPAKFYDKLQTGHPALLDHTVNTLFREAPERRMVRTMDFGKDSPEGEKYVRAFLSDRYRRLDNYDLAQAALTIAQDIPDVQIPTSQITEGYMHLTLLAPRVQGDVGLNDTVQAGIRITNSEIGWGALKVEPLVYRLVCLNGMVVAKATKQYHIGRQIDSEETLHVLSDETVALDDKAFFSKLQDVMRAAVDETNFNAIVAQMRDANSGEKIEKPIETMERLQTKFGLGDGEKDNVLKHLIEGGNLTAFGTLNAMTRAAQDVESYDRSMELERFGGQLLEMAGTPEWRKLAVA